jgi:uncharacterized YccA/Bax inhibitor family protein
MIKSSNPALNANIFNTAKALSSSKETMTVQGTVNKTTILLLCAIFTASWTWGMPVQQAMGLGLVGAIGGFIVGMITHFKKESAHITAPVYALLQGLFLGGISSMLEQRYPGIVIQAIGLTFGTLFSLLGAYKSGLIKVTENFKLGIAAATGGIAIFYFASFILGFFGVRFSAIHGSGIMGIGFSLIVVVIASLNLVMDFDFIENGEAVGAPKYMEWYAAFGLIVTLIWLYIEILRLLSKLRDRR